MIKLLAHLDHEVWTLEGTADSHFIDLGIGARENDNVGVGFVNVSFGFEFFNEDGLLDFGNFPADGVRFNYTEDDVMSFNRIQPLEPETKYWVRAWLKDAGIDFSETFEITTSRPEQPYPSWRYESNIKEWIAPVSYPQDRPSDEEQYVWDEENQSWSIEPK